ncbi:MAG TPA: diguanylate cyclase [Solirubrobacterales bacterium]|nr:diguanylate cyclase [Solirubrobacterales bacterium]
MRFRFFLGLAAVAAIAIGSAVGGLVVRTHETHAFERRQRDEALRSARQAEALAALSVGQLASATAFYEVEGTFTQHEFEAMADSLLGSGALSGTGLIETVPASRRAQFERSHGYPIVERTPIGFRRAHPRPYYYPLTFATSNSGLEPPLGYDLGADPARSTALLRAANSGKPAATRVMHLPIGGTGINVFRPVYRDGAPTATVAQRRAALAGFAVGAFHVPDLTAAATSALPDDIDVQLVESGHNVAGPQLPRDETAATPLRIADRTWLLVVHDPNRPDISLPLLIAVFGISMAALLGALVLIWSRNERMQELQLQASQDPLTGLKNRRRFEEDMRTEIARSHREGNAGALLMLDLDNFKQVNDTLGHPVGDRMIADIAGVLRARMRLTDVLARLGGDEFAIVLPRCSVEKARGVGAEIATAVREHAADEEAVPRITVSVGIAMFGPGLLTDLESLEEEADAALYEAKRAGRDSVRVAGSATLPSPSR